MCVLNTILLVAHELTLEHHGPTPRRLAPHDCQIHTAIDTVSTVCCSVLQCVAVCCSVLQCVAVRCSVLPCPARLPNSYCHPHSLKRQYSALQCVAVCCSVLQCAAVSHTAIDTVSNVSTVRYSMLQCVAVCCSVLQCVAVC